MPRVALFATSFAVVLLGLGACQTTDLSEVTGSLGDKAETKQAAADPRTDLAADRARFKASPNDPDAALRYGNALRANGQREQAVAVLEQATIANPSNRALLAGYGRALADNGNFQQAFDVLSRAHSPEDPDWHILSAQGAALDQLGQHEEARQYYATALKIAPDEPSVLSNVGLSYLLTNDLPKAEENLRRAYAHAGAGPRVRTNLAIVVGLQGRMSEAEGIMRSGVPPEQATAQIASLRRLLVRKQIAQQKGPMAAPPDKNLAKLLSSED